MDVNWTIIVLLGQQYYVESGSSKEEVGWNKAFHTSPLCNSNLFHEAEYLLRI
jgi:hypothetical protein